MAGATQTNGRAARVARIAASAGTGGLQQALQDFAAEAPKLRTNADGQIQNRIYRYVTLDGLLDDIAPLLLKHELLWVTKPTTDEHGQPALRYTITHVPSGESDEDVLPLLGATDSQAFGSAITYARRYALVAYLNLAPGEDDDGAAASLRAPVDRYAEAEAAAAESGSTVPQPTAKPAKASERPVTANQREKLLKPRARKAGLTAGQFANVILVAKGEAPRQWSSGEHASQALDFELDRLPARLKDAVLEGIALVAEGAKGAKS
jgi:hypothetical protein